MGAKNVTKVFAHWTHLGNREARALAYMANLTMDEARPPVYFGGWEAIASAIGSPATTRTDSRRRTAMRVLADLTCAGAIVSSGQARPGVRAEYAVALDPSHTYAPLGEGKNVSWVEVIRNDGPVTASVTGHDDPEEPTCDSFVHEPVTLTVPTCDSFVYEPVTLAVTPRNNLRNNEEQLKDKDSEATATQTEISIAGDEESEVIENQHQTAQTLIAEWIDSSPRKPPGRIIGHLSKEIKTLLDEGYSYEEVRAATIEWDSKPLHPSTLPSILHGMGKKSAGTPRAKMEATLDMGTRLQQAYNDQQQRQIGN